MHSIFIKYVKLLIISKLFNMDYIMLCMHNILNDICKYIINECFGLNVSFLQKNYIYDKNYHQKSPKTYL